MNSVEDDLRWRRTLLTALGTFAPDEASELAIHLGDLRHGFVHAIQLIEEIARTDEGYDPAGLRVALANLKGELLDHLRHHLEEVDPPLTAVVSRLFQQADDAGEFGDQ